MLRRLGGLCRDERGAMAIEMAIIAPVLALMAIGTFEGGMAVSRQQELQSAASEAEGIILAAASGTGTDSAKVEAVIENSLGLGADQVHLEQQFRCNTESALTASASNCPTDEPIYQYVELEVTDDYTPVWVKFGIGGPFTYRVTRTVQIQ